MTRLTGPLLLVFLTGATLAKVSVVNSIQDEPPQPVANQKRLICYFSAWAFYRPDYGKYDIDDIDVDLCTHITYAFASMNNQTWKAYAYDPWYDLSPSDEGCDAAHCHYDSMRRFNKLKQKNPNLKTLLSFGGWNTGSGQWSIMAKDKTKRDIFVQSSLRMVQTFGFDGIDFDWEYPGFRDGSDVDHDKEDFTVLVQEMSSALHEQGLILTAATSPDPKKAENAYDIPKVFAAMDFVNVMDYDYHGAWDNFTGVNTPLYHRKEETEPDHPGHYFNVNDTLNWYIDQGAPPEKINLGIAAYGRGFTLDNSTQNGLYCPAYEPLPGGPTTREPGMVSYVEVMHLLSDAKLPTLPDAIPRKWNFVTDGCYKVPYAYNGPYWMSFDTTNSAKLKTQFVNYRNLGGAMVFALDMDDFKGIFQKETYPITRTVKAVLESGDVLSPDNILEENSGCESSPVCEL